MSCPCSVGRDYQRHYHPVKPNGFSVLLILCDTVTRMTLTKKLVKRVIDIWLGWLLRLLFRSLGEKVVLFYRCDPNSEWRWASRRCDAKFSLNSSEWITDCVAIMREVSEIHCREIVGFDIHSCNWLPTVFIFGAVGKFVMDCTGRIQSIKRSVFARQESQWANFVDSRDYFSA